jgi:hypothetical protein
VKFYLTLYRILISSKLLKKILSVAKLNLSKDYGWISELCWIHDN